MQKTGSLLVRKVSHSLLVRSSLTQNHFTTYCYAFTHFVLSYQYQISKKFTPKEKYICIFGYKYLHMTRVLQIFLSSVLCGLLVEKLHVVSCIVSCKVHIFLTLTFTCPSIKPTQLDVTVSVVNS